MSLSCLNICFIVDRILLFMPLSCLNIDIYVFIVDRILLFEPLQQFNRIPSNLNKEVHPGIILASASFPLPIDSSLLQQSNIQFHILDPTFWINSLLRIFPEADLGTLFMNVTLRNLLKGATYDKEAEFRSQMHAKTILTLWFHRLKVQF